MKENIVLFMTKRLAVRRLHADDDYLLYQYSGEESNRELPNEVFDSIDDVRKHLDLVIANYRRMQYPLRYAIVLKEKNLLIGTVSFKRMPDYNIQLNIMIAKEYRNMGYATEAVEAAVDYIKDHRGVEEVYALARTENMAARNVMEKAVFLLLTEYEADWFGMVSTFCKYKV
ncbi:MAG TPA: GNAT family N-acetyltransferase [Lachnospiraceae bacterium]|nr:GNAT family N-acetyltransferase [Lachnospiraceae bacterium]HPF28549.1 GNAT family N-acetyltransferase [Lachnospiraceae bacterium]